MKELERIDRFSAHSPDELRRMVKMALLSGAIELLSVDTDEEWSAKIKVKYEGLRQCLVSRVKLPTRDILADSVIRPEMVAFLASREAIRRLRGGAKVGLSGGTTLARFVDFLPHGSPDLAGIKWYALLATKRTPSIGTSAANDVLARVTYNHPGSEGFRLPFIAQEQRSSAARSKAFGHTREQLDLAYRLLGEIQEVQEVILSLGSAEYNYRQSNYYMGLEQLGSLLNGLEDSDRVQLAGDILLQLVDREGNRFGSTTFQRKNDRLVFSVGLNGLKQIATNNNVWALVTRESKALVARASVKGGYVNGLILDNWVAKRLDELP